jgi:pimeloyl-ACP methyl ester carboxylesterase
VLIGAVPPIMVKSEKNPGGLPLEVFDGFRAALAANRAQFYVDVPAGPFYGFNRPGAKVSQGIIDNWWRQGMMGGAKAHYDCIKAFSETDFTEDLKKIEVPVLVMHGDDDQIVPIADSAPLSAKLLKNGTLKTYDGLPARHGDHPCRRHQRRSAGFLQGLIRPTERPPGNENGRHWRPFACVSCVPYSAATILPASHLYIEKLCELRSPVSP